MLTPEQARRMAQDIFGDDAASESDAAWGGAVAAQTQSPQGLAHEHGHKSEPFTPLPKHIGTYQIHGVIARGGMGTVYLGRQTNPERLVAVKVFLHGDVQRFRQEARTLAALSHPGIAHVYESGSFDDGFGGKPYFAMEYLPNAEPITRFAQRMRLGVHERLELFAHVCDAVQHAHLKSVIHRDLKPGNILVTYEHEKTEASDPISAVNHPLAPGSAGGCAEQSISVQQSASQETRSGGQLGWSEGEPHDMDEGADSAPRALHGAEDGPARALTFDTPTSALSSPRVKVIDFGIARVTDADLQVTLLPTTRQEILGTLQYMSPEQCTGDPANIDQRTDIYSLGVILYELLCDQPPHDLRGTPILQATRIICETPAPPPSSLRRKLHRDIEAVVLKALEKDPARRYQHAADLAADVRRFMRKEPVEARMPSRWVKAARWVGRHPVLSTMAFCLAILFLTLVCSAGFVWWYNFRPFAVELLSSRKEARLISVGGTILHRWTCEREGGIVFAEYIPKGQFGAARGMCLIGYSAHAGVDNARLLCAFDPAVDLQEPIWRGTINQPITIELTRGTSTFQPNQFEAYWGMVENIFVDGSGPEIVTAFQLHALSLCIIQIRDMQGILLYQAIHDGPLTDAVWLRTPRMLICSGVNSELSWKDRGCDARCEIHDPVIVLGVRPERGQLQDVLLLNHPTPSPRLCWYRCILPCTLCNYFAAVTVDHVTPAETSSESVRLNLELRDVQPPGSISFLIDETGSEVINSRRRSNGFLDAPSRDEADKVYLSSIPRKIPSDPH